MTLYRGDCLWMMQAIPDASVDLVLCDLPYGTTQNKWDAVIPFTPLWEQYRRICKGAVVLTAAQPFTSALVMSNIEDFKYQWVWEKTNCSGFANAKRQPLRNHEDVLVFYSSPSTYNPQDVISCVPKVRTAKTGANMGRTGFKDGYVQTVTGYPKTVQKFASERNTVHPTQKPVALMEYLIRTYTDEGMTVLDNCMGSGTTGVACVNTGRNFIGIERDPNYFKISQERIEEAQFQHAIREAERLFA